MNETDRDRFRQSVDWAIRNIEKDARCFGYGDEPEYLELLTAFKVQQEKTFGDRNEVAEKMRLQTIYELVNTVSHQQAYNMLLQPDTTEEERRFWSFVGDTKFYTEKYHWSDPIIASDHQLLHVSRIDTGETIMLPARVPVGRKLPTLVQCKIYHLDDGNTIAIGKCEDLTIIFKGGESKWR